jgi:hypothetical protein
LYGYSGQRWLTGIFDIQIDLSSITAPTGRATAFRFSAQTAGAVNYAKVSYEWSGTDALWQAKSASGVISEYGALEDTGKLRLTRDGAGAVKAFIWNSSLARWEWNGDPSGVVVETTPDDLQIVLHFFAGSTYPPSDVLIAVDNFYLWEGCAETSLSSSSSSSSCLSSSSSSSSYFPLTTALPRWKFKAQYSRPYFIALSGRQEFVEGRNLQILTATHRRSQFVAQFGRPSFLARLGR